MKKANRTDKSMGRRSLLTFFVVLACFLAVHARANAFSARELKQFQPISKRIARASKLAVFEGLPHPMFEARLVEKEIATKKTVRLHGFVFYQRPLSISAEVVTALRRLSSAEKSYETYDGPKFCGGFHPDYCLAWTDGKTTCHLLLCFGCGEMKLYGPKTELIVNIRKEACGEFKGILKRLRDQRPQPELP